MRSILSLALLLTTMRCITTTYPGDATFSATAYFAESDKVPADDGNPVAHVPPLLPEKDNTEASMSKSELHQKVFAALGSAQFRQKRVFIFLGKHYWSASFAGNVEVRRGFFSHENAILGKLHARSENITDPAAFQSLKDYLQYSAYFRDFEIGTQGYPSNTAGYDYIVYLAKTEDNGDHYDTPMTFLSIFTLFIAPMRFSHDESYFLYVFDKDGNRLGLAKITISKSDYAGFSTCFLPFWWGDPYKEPQVQGNLFVYLFEKAVAGK